MKHTILTLAVTSLLATTTVADPIHDAARKGDIEAVEERLNFLTTLFLVIAEKYSYFYPHDGFVVRAKGRGGANQPNLDAYLSDLQKEIGSTHRLRDKERLCLFTRV